MTNVTGISSTENIVSLTGAKENNITRLFCVTANDIPYPGVLIEELFWGYAGVYRLEWGQSSWTLQTNGLPNNAGIVLAAMARNNNSIIYVAGGEVATEYPTVFKSTDGGLSWTNCLFVNNNLNIHTGWAGQGGDRGWSYSTGVIGLNVAPNNANRVAITDYGFTHITTDGAATWHQAYLNPNDQNPAGAVTPQRKSYRGSGLEDTACWSLLWSDETNIFACFTDIRGIRTTNGGSSWSFDYTGHNQNTMYHAVKHPVTGRIFAGTSGTHDLYQTTYLTDGRIEPGVGRVIYSDDKGATWQLFHDFNEPVIWLSLDPTDNNQLYASVVTTNQGGIYVSTNIQNGAMATWQKLSDPPRTQGHPFNIHILNGGALVASYCARRAGSPLAFTPSSGVFISTNSGLSWQDRSDPNMFYYTKDVVIDPHDPNQNTWYACVWSGWGGPPNGLGGLYRTTNRGQTWSRLNNMNRVSSMAINPLNPAEAYLTTETEGLWISTNINMLSPIFDNLVQYPFRQPERVFYNPFDPTKVWVTSFGNGIRFGDSTDTNTPLNQVRFSANAYQVNETNSPLSINIIRTGGNNALPVYYTFSGNTGAVETTTLSGIISIPAQSNIATLNISP